MNRRFLMIMTISVSIQVVKEQILPLVFVMEPMDVSVREGADVLLRCKITGIGCSCKWTRGSEVIKIGKGSMYQYKSDKERGDCSLRINQTSRIDENLWSCQIQSPLGTFTSRTAQISFIVPPEAPIIYFGGKDISSQYPIAVPVSSRVRLECISRKGKPASTLEWTPDIPLKNVHSFIQQSADDPHLQDSIIMLDTSRFYVTTEYVILCIANHPGYNTKITAKARISVQSQREQSPPVIYNRIRGVFLEGRPVDLYCRVGFKNSGCQWIRGGHVLNFTKDSIFYHTTNPSPGSCLLSITQTRRADENLWSCQISMLNYKVISKPVQISFIVLPDPPIIRFQNQYIEEEQTIEVNQSQPILVECVSRNGKPKSFLEWVGDINATDVQHFSQSNSEDPRLQDSILIWNTQGWSKPGNYTVQCIARHIAYPEPDIIHVKFTVARDTGSIQSKEQNFCQDKGFPAVEENTASVTRDAINTEKADYQGSKSDFETTIGIAVTVISVTIIGIFLGIHIKRRRRSHIIATEAEVQTASLPTYLVVLPNLSNIELSNRPQFPLPRGTILSEHSDDGSFSDNTYTEIDDLIMSRAVNHRDHQVSPLTESAEHCCYQVPSLESVADETQDIYYTPGNEQTSPL